MDGDSPSDAQCTEGQEITVTNSWAGLGVLSREAVRTRLQAAALQSTAQGVPAAVLIGLVGHPDEPRIILTERTAHLRNHAAQVSFPGGRIEDVDRDPADAALREAFEEIGLPAERIELLGRLEPVETVSGFLVHPFVGWIEPPVEFVVDPEEVAEVFEVPLGFVLDPANRRWESKYLDGMLRGYYVFSYPGHRIWGATAGLLVDLAEVLAISPGDITCTTSSR